jgi:Ca-activated chloride channel family protein
LSSNYYNLLSVPFDATEEEIRESYYKAARIYHPDTSPEPETKQLFLDIQDAYTILSDEEKRRQYNYRFTEDEVASGTALKVFYSRSSIPLLDESQAVYALLQLECKREVTTSQLPALELCLVIDRSTSMEGTRLSMVKKNIDYVLKQLRPIDTLSIVVFSDRAEILIPPSFVADYPRFEKKLSEINTFGATEIFRGLDMGVSILKKSIHPDHIRSVILLTDGHTYGDEEKCYELSKSATADKISISAMGLGSEWNDEFLDKMTSISGGNAGYARSEKDLFDFFKEKLSSSINQYANNVVLEFESDPQVDLNYAFRLYPEITPLPLLNPINLGNLTYGQKIILILEFIVKKVSSEKKALKLMEGKIKLEAPSRVFNIERHLAVCNLPVKIAFEKESPPSILLDALSRLTLYRMQQRARDEVKAKSFVSASTHLNFLASKLNETGEKELANTVILEANELKKKKRFSEDGEKRIKYGTRALLLKSGLE